jgi:hypothetical protein
MTTGMGYYKFVDSVTGKNTFGEEDNTVKLWKIKKLHKQVDKKELPS